MTQTLPSLTTEAAALSVAGAGLRQYQMGSALIGAGADATVVILEPGDDSEVSGVQTPPRCSCAATRSRRSIHGSTSGKPCPFTSSPLAPQAAVVLNSLAAASTHRSAAA
ncbi:hypothetical protein SVIOM74S_07162 [Streptomyces violarus]